MTEAEKKLLEMEFIARLHDPTYRYAALVDDLAGKVIHLLDTLRMFKPLLTHQDLAKQANEVRMYSLNLARSNYGWNFKELPLEVTFDIMPPPSCKLHTDFRGLLGPYVAARVSQLLDVTTKLPPSTFSDPTPDDTGVAEELGEFSDSDDEPQDPQGPNAGFRFGR